MKAPTKAAKAARDKAMRADRARGHTVRQLAKTYGLSLASVHEVVADVRLVLPNPWHKARMPKEAPLSAITSVHRLYMG